MVTHTIREHGKLLEVRFDLRVLEFVNPEVVGLEWQHSSILTDS